MLRTIKKALFVRHFTDEVESVFTVVVVPMVLSPHVHLQAVLVTVSVVGFPGGPVPVAAHGLHVTRPDPLTLDLDVRPSQPENPGAEASCQKRHQQHQFFNVSGIVN